MQATSLRSGLEEALAMRGVAEGFRAAGTRCRESAGEVTASQARWQVGSMDVFVQEAGVEAVAGADGVNCRYFLCRTVEALASFLREGSFLAELYHDKWHERGQFLDRGFQIFSSSCFACFALIGEKDVHAAENVL